MECEKTAVQINCSWSDPFLPCHARHPPPPGLGLCAPFMLLEKPWVCPKAGAGTHPGACTLAGSYPGTELCAPSLLSQPVLVQPSQLARTLSWV